MLNHTAYKTATVNIMNLDADQFLMSTHEQYDVVIIDFPDPSQIELCKLYSLEFFAQLKNDFVKMDVSAFKARAQCMREMYSIA